MAEGDSKMDKSDLVHPAIPSPDLRATSASPSSRAGRWKLSRSASKGWFNKSFDQSTLSKRASPNPGQFRRQSSVSDFFQSMLTKSRSHFIGLFSGSTKKENTRQAMLNTSDSVGSALDERMSPNSLSRDKTSEIRSEKSKTFQFSSKSSLSSENLTYSIEPTNRNVSPSRVTRPDTSDCKDRSTVKGRTSPADMFIVSANNDLQKKTPLGKTSSPLRSSSQSLPSQREENRPQSFDTKAEFLLGPRTARELNTSAYSQIPHSSSITFSVVDFTDPGMDGSDEVQKEDSYTYRQISSAPGGVGRQSLSTEVSFLRTNGDKTLTNTKRALVKSNSDTITKFSAGLAPITKASSDGNCFRASHAKSSMSNPIVAKITDYLFVGSVEAAYNEPLLCKYKITSLIDMTNIQPRVVPLHKKSDCPCACINKDHFRSKLNIGVDDIEWENLEQYFKEINAFIDGSRKKRGRTLIFSYIGQSRAPAAAIQHLMHHYGMSYREAFTIVVSKWPQTKLNSGFVKTLKRLEVNLSQEKDKTKTLSPLKRFEASAYEKEVTDGKGEQISEFAPPVVRGAWLEC